MQAADKTGIQTNLFDSTCFFCRASSSVSYDAAAPEGGGGAEHLQQGILWRKQSEGGTVKMALYQLLCGSTVIIILFSRGN